MGILRRYQPAQPSQPADPDALLVAWSQQNPHAFTAIYDRYFAAVDGYCLNELGDPQAAEDAASQSFLKALSALPSYREGGRFRSWLFAIAHNTVQDAIRARRVQSSLEDAVDVQDIAAGPEERAIAVLDAAWLDGVIAGLPTADRQVLELRRAGLSGPEIAAALGISHEAAKKRQLRAIDQIRADVAATAGNREVLRGA